MYSSPSESREKCSAKASFSFNMAINIIVSSKLEIQSIVGTAHLSRMQVIVKNGTFTVCFS
jgi:hypothetical protein